MATAVDQKWPPVDWLWQCHSLNGAWYSGDEAALRRYTQGFWRDDSKHKGHVPIAADLAALSAGYLFSGSPVIRSDDPKTDERLQKILKDAGVYQAILQAAEFQSAFGGAFLKLNWDKNLVKRPIVEVVAGNGGIPKYRHGILTGCTFWSEVRGDENTGSVWRLREQYNNDGSIDSALFQGDSERLGKQVGLESIDETRGIQAHVQSGTGRLLAVYIPNKLPNRRLPHSPYGSSDYEGLYGLFSALDLAYSSLMRDVRLSQTRVVVPMEFLRRKQVFQDSLDSRPYVDFVYSSGDEIYAAMDIDPQNSGAGVTAIQPEIRSTQLLETINDIIRRIYMMAGFSPQSAGIDISGSAESGTALNIRERRSLQTAETKKNYWWHGLMELTKSILALDNAVFRTGVDPEAEITVTFADNTQPDMQTVADTVQKMSAAGAASTKTKVSLLHPDWDEKEIQEEIDAIGEEKAMAATAYDTPSEDVLSGDEEDDAE